jgi:hypothetical protein
MLPSTDRRFRRLEKALGLAAPIQAFGEIHNIDPATVNDRLTSLEVDVKAQRRRDVDNYALVLDRCVDVEKRLKALEDAVGKKPVTSTLSDLVDFRWFGNTITYAPDTLRDRLAKIEEDFRLLMNALGMERVDTKAKKLVVKRKK